MTTSHTQGEHAQPEALRLADSLERCWGDARLDEAAAELRRLHAQVAALTAAPQGGAYVENPAEIEHVAGDVSKNRAESNMTGGAYAELPEPDVRRLAIESGLIRKADSLRPTTWGRILRFAQSIQALRASHGQAPAGATLDVFGLQWPGEDRINLSTVFDTEAEALEYRDNRCDTPGILVVRLSAQPSTTAQPAPASIPNAYAGRERGAYETGWKEGYRHGAWANAEPAVGAVAELDPVGMVPVAEVVECEKMGQQALREIDGRWRWLSIGERLYARADTGIAAAPTPAAQGDAWPSDDEVRAAYKDAFGLTPAGAIWLNLGILAEALRTRRAALAQKEVPHGN
jgi:hypothetical protein